MADRRIDIQVRAKDEATRTLQKMSQKAKQSFTKIEKDSKSANTKMKGHMKDFSKVTTKSFSDSTKSIQTMATKGSASLNKLKTSNKRVTDSMKSQWKTLDKTITRSMRNRRMRASLAGGAGAGVGAGSAGAAGVGAGIGAGLAGGGVSFPVGGGTAATMRLGGATEKLKHQITSLNKVIHLEHRAIGKTKEATAKLAAEKKRLTEATKKSTAAVKGGIPAWAKLIGVIYVAKKGYDILIGSTAAHLDSIGKASTKLGISTDALQKMGFVAERSGMSVQNMNMNLQRMTRRVGEAAQGTGTAVGALGKLGLKAKDLVKLKGDEMFLTIGKAMEGITNESERMTILFDIFGLAGAELNQVFRQGHDSIKAMTERAVELGAVVDEDLIKSAERYEDAVLDLGKAWLGVKAIVAGPMIGAMTDLFNMITGAGVPAVIKLQRELLDAAAAEEAAFKAKDKWYSIGGQKDYELARANRIEAEKRLAAVKKEIAAKQSYGKSGGGGGGDGLKPGWRSQEESDALMLGARSFQQREAYNEEGDFSAASIQASNAMIAKEKEMREELMKSGAAWRKMHEERGGMGAPLQKQLDYWEKLQEGATKAFTKMGEEANDFEGIIGNMSASIAESFASGMTDALWEWIEGTKNAKDAFRDFALSFLKMIAQMIVQQMILNLVKQAASSYFGAAEGGIFPGGFQSMGPVQKFAGGGIVKQPTMGLIGEGGEDEAIIPLKHGAVPVLLKGGNGGGLTIQNNIQVDAGAGGDDEDKKQLANEISRQMEARTVAIIEREKRPGGVLNRQQRGVY